MPQQPVQDCRTVLGTGWGLAVVFLWGCVCIFQAAYVIQNSRCSINAALDCFPPEGRNAVINASIALFSLAKILFKH